MVIWASAMLGIAVTLLVIAVFSPKKNILAEKMRALETMGANVSSRHTPNDDFVERVIKPLLSGVTHRIGKNMQRMSVSDMENRLTLAGNPLSLNVEQFASLKAIVAVVLTFACIVLTAGLNGLSSSTFLWGIVGIIGGWFLPDLWLESLKNKRQKAITMELPSILDILVVTTEAGLTFDAALRRICDNTQGVLTNEIEKTIEELQLNIPRREALRNLADRCGVDDLSIFLTSIIQAESHGTSVSNILRAQAQRVRDKVRHRIEEKGGKVAVWLLFPTVIFIIPSLFIVVLGSAIIDLGERMF